MKYIADHDLHVHTLLSNCSNDPGQTTAAILEYAKRNNLKTVCVTDHCWNLDSVTPEDWYLRQNFEHIKKNLPLPKAQGIEFLFGAEADMNLEGIVGWDKKDFDKVDFLLIAITHLNKVGFTITEEEAGTPESKAKVLLRRFDALLNTDLPWHKVGIAHLTDGLIHRGDREFLKNIFDLLPEEELSRLFKKAAKLGAGIEINASAINYKEDMLDSVWRIYKIAKESGCKFYLGTDTHHPGDLDARFARFQNAIDVLGLTEDDKFIIKR